MRIIGGEYGGRKFNPPSKMPYTRPTTDIAKEGLFNILQHSLQIEGLIALDLFGGTGNISYELVSRGAKEVTIIEKDRIMYEYIKKTARELGIENMKPLKMDVFRYMEQTHDRFDLIFAGPPYALANIDDLPRLAFDKNMLNPKGWFILEHTPRNSYQGRPFFKTERNYGTTIFSIFINN